MLAQRSTGRRAVIALALLAQAVAAGPPAPAAAATALAQRDHVAFCAPAPAEDGDIVVCGRKDRDEQYRLRPLTHRYDPVAGPGLGFKVGAGQANVYAASQQSPDGKPDKRIMVTLTLPF